MIFQYFIPGVAQAQISPELLRRIGLGDALRDCLRPEDFGDAGRLSIHPILANGPNGSSGTIVAALPDFGQPEIGYYPDRQTWEPWGEYWIGTANGAPPTPLTLARPLLLEGYERPLGDGQVWQCPTIRRPTGASNLPRVMRRNVAGELRFEVVPEFAWAWQLAGEVWDRGFAGGEADFNDVFNWSAKILGLNYRVGPAECSRLGLVTTTNFMDILKAAIDWPLVEELLSKKNDIDRAAGPANTSPGPPAA